jgi:hypothetical protein
VSPRLPGLHPRLVARFTQGLAPRLPGIPDVEPFGATVRTDDRGIQVQHLPQHAALEDVCRAVRLALGDRLPFAAEVRQEMQTFTSRINPDTAHESFSSWHEQSHDDILLAMSLCTWWGEEQHKHLAGVW